MKQIIVIFVFSAVFGICWCRSRYIAIPLEDVGYLDMNEYTRPQIRIPRKVNSIHPIPQRSEYPSDPISEENRYARQSGGGGGHHPYVDYGAHTGHHGSFGWYADFPVHKGS